MSQQPTSPGLSDRLKQLQHNTAPLNSPDFTLDDVVRGGRRRRQRRSIAQVAAAVVAVAALGTGIALPQLRGDRDTAPVAATSTAPTPALPTTKAVDLSGEALTFTQKGATVTALNKGAVVATLSLKSATYTARSGHAVFTLDAKQPVLFDRAGFLLYDAKGGENHPDSQAKVTLAAGQSRVVVDFTDTRAEPQAIGWVPFGSAGVWER